MFYKTLDPSGVFLALHASEQYFTSAQFLAQLLRQVISRPQARQTLLGSAALLPLNPDIWGISSACCGSDAYRCGSSHGAAPWVRSGRYRQYVQHSTTAFHALLLIAFHARQ